MDLHFRDDVPLIRHGSEFTIDSPCLFPEIQAKDFEKKGFVH